jgi:phosphatidylinositol-bisphosphatase/inositol-1,4,5-trisphosphate 5-phosphatase
MGKEWRIPGWTDRIIFKVNRHILVKQMEAEFYLKQHKKGQIINITDEGIEAENELQLHNYDANFEIFGSDHRPVFAQFQALI